MANKLLTITVVFYICFAVSVTLIHCRASQRVCNTIACKNIASTIKKNMDDNVKQCDDFYQFACGNYKKDEDVPNDILQMDPIGEINEKIMKKLNSYLQKDNRNKFEKHLEYIKDRIDEIVIKEVKIRNPVEEFFGALKNFLIKNIDKKVWNPNHIMKDLDMIKNYIKKNFNIKAPSLNSMKKIRDVIKNYINENLNKRRPSFLNKLFLYYQSCTNEENVQKDERDHLMKLLDKVGGWPVLTESWDEKRFDWIKSMYTLRDEGLRYNAFMNVMYQPDIQTKITVIALDKSPLSLNLSPRILLTTDHKLVGEYYKYMVEMAVALGANRSRAEKELKQSLNFEIEMARILVNPILKQDSKVLSNPKTIGELYENYKNCSIPWETYLTKILKPPIPLSMSDKVIVHDPAYLHSLCSLLARTKSKKILANYAVWSVISLFTPMLGPKAVQLTKDWQEKLLGKSIKEIRWKKCVSLSKTLMPLAVGALYVRNIYDGNIKKTKEVASEMVNQIRQEMAKSIKREAWMDNSTRMKALKKLDKMTFLVAYPKELQDDTKLNDIFRNLRIDRDSYLKSTLNLIRLGWDLQARGYQKPIVKNSWFELFGDPSTPNAFYTPLDNSFMLLASLLQEPFFHADYPKYINFAGIGSVIGHEMSHGFDVRGSIFDENGQHFDWWDEATKKVYSGKAGCFIHQYDDFGKVKNISINGTFTLSENMADNVGLKQTYSAYNTWMKKNPKEPRLPGLEQFTPEQMFWLSYANSLCSKTPPGPGSTTDLMIDNHAPNHLRVLATLANIPEFSRDFNCPVGSFMNRPNKTCSVW
ncbi:hypothetical protein QAD02_005137 [Eretmocerus hayati]|uniref:Uncharacterized protein n=1 Tax=Eretmocerus hayati TaxID=131215 RepID=A0ACC2NWE9_9HYME|nr:hypothetical protein QAD02_005137 [Eretmocerus hayati]